MKQRRVIVSVINDLVTDQRVHRSCMLMHEMGFEVLLIGRALRSSLPVNERPYSTLRIKLLFEGGALFYACFNVRLFLLLIFRKADFFYSNDLDTLLPNYLISKLKRKPLIYDAHEYFTGVPELVNRPRVQMIWKWIERRTVPHMKHMVTVNQSIAELYADEYGIEPAVVRNIPASSSGQWQRPTRKEMGLPENTKILILQGSGINIQRGAEEAVEAMKYTEGVLLLIVGGGDVIELLRKMAEQMGLQKKVRFVPKVPMEELRAYTSLADGGLTLDKDTNINYRFSLPNKLFDYIHAGIPVLASDLPEIRKIVDRYGIGLITPDHDPENLAAMMKQLLFDNDLRAGWMHNLPVAAKELCWEAEQHNLAIVIHNAFTR
jgi:glycosyltransferase involved in cell wall biosynthesis